MENIQLTLLGLYRHNYPLEMIGRILHPIGREILGCALRISEAENEGNELYLDAVIDEETEFIEILLGTTFLICQPYITYIVSKVMKLHDSYKKKARLKTTNGKKNEIMRLGSKLIPGTSVYEVQVIDAFANYYKHHEEKGWSGLWAKFQRPSRDTAELMQAVGAKQFSTGIFRTAAEVLGNPDFSNLSIFVDILRAWSQKVFSAYDTELKSLGLLDKGKGTL